jgi:hypothetical protein
MGLTLLRDVYEKSVTAAAQSSAASVIGPRIPLLGWFITPAYIRAGARATYTALLIAAYYSSQNETRLMKEWIPKARAAHRHFAKRYTDLWVGRASYNINEMNYWEKQSNTEMQQVEGDLEKCIALL